jgi:thiamine kinase-like enzyme
MTPTSGIVTPHGVKKIDKHLDAVRVGENRNRWRRLLASVNVNVEEIISRIDQWKGFPVSYERLGSLVNNYNYKIKVGREVFILRIPADQNGVLTNRSHEIANMKAAAISGVSPPLVHHLLPEHITIIPYIPGTSLSRESIVENPPLLRRIVHTIKFAHENIHFQSFFDPFTTSDRYLSVFHMYKAPLPKDFPQLRKRILEIRRSLARSSVRLVSCHNDLTSENFIVRDHKIWIIDWEYGGLGDPFYDLGNFSAEHLFTSEMEELIIAEYCGSCNEQSLFRLRLYKVISDYWWGVWSMLQSRLSDTGFDFYGHGIKKFTRMREHLASVGFTKCLANV